MTAWMCAGFRAHDACLDHHLARANTGWRTAHATASRGNIATRAA